MADERGRKNKREVRRAQTPDTVEVFSLPEFFPIPPQPLPGVEFTLQSADSAELVGVSPESGFPVDTLVNTGTGEPSWVEMPEFNRLGAALDEGLASPEIREKRERARERLVRDGVQGHAVTSATGGGRETARRLYPILKFGLWPERMGDNGERGEVPWVGDFEVSNTGSMAGDFFRSVAFVPKHSKEELVQLPPEYGGGSFVPSKEMWVVVPDEGVKNALIGLTRGDPFAQHDAETMATLQENIVTYDDVITNGVESDFRL